VNFYKKRNFSVKKPIKKILTKQASSAANVAALKKEFKAKLTELSKQFDNQLAEVKKIAEVKAMKEVHDTFAKFTKTKDKAVKEALSQVDKVRAVTQKAKNLIKLKPIKTSKGAKPKKIVKRKT
jgi:hypothetical protein